MKNWILNIFGEKKNKEKNNLKDMNQTNNIEFTNTYYENIPLFSRNDFINAKEDNSKDSLYDLYRKAINGYASLYDNKWLVWRNCDGSVSKTSEFSKLYGDWEFSNVIQAIESAQSKAIRAENMHKTIFCKFSYDIKDQEIFATHVVLEKEYIPDEIYVDCGKLAGIHFVEIENIKFCLDRRNTYYGNKIVLLSPVSGEIYYEYRDNVFEGNKVFVNSVLKMDDIETWRYLASLSSKIKQLKHEIVDYLKCLNDSIDYTDCIEYVNNL